MCQPLSLPRDLFPSVSSALNSKSSASHALLDSMGPSAPLFLHQHGNSGRVSFPAPCPGPWPCHCLCPCPCPRPSHSRRQMQGPHPSDGGRGSQLSSVSPTVFSLLLPRRPRQDRPANREPGSAITSGTWSGARPDFPFEPGNRGFLLVWREKLGFLPTLPSPQDDGDEKEQSAGCSQDPGPATHGARDLWGCTGLRTGRRGPEAPGELRARQPGSRPPRQLSPRGPAITARGSVRTCTWDPGQHGFSRLT